MKSQKSKKNKQSEINQNSSFFIGLFVNFFKPSVYLNSVRDIDLNTLKKQGIKLIICDLDNTLVPHYTKFPTKMAIDFVQSAKKLDFDFFLVSNNTSKRVSFFADKLGITKYVSNAKKPFHFSIKKIIKNNNYSPKEVVVIGDLIISDIFAANLLKTESILVKPIVDSTEVINRTIAFFEAKVFKKLSRENLLTKSDNFSKILLDEEFGVL